jgi:SnoaL-like protein
MLPLLAACVLPACGGEGGPRPSDAQVIRAWSRALNQGNYDRAASYFAPGAIVEQAEVFRLPGRRAAIAFNQSLPCRADITDIRDEGSTTLASFRLREGPGGPGASCDGSARVRFRLQEGRFREWRQLPEAPPPRGQTA